MYSKKVEIRRRAREQQVTEYKAKIRENMLDSYAKTEKVNQYNSAVLGWLGKGDGDRLFEALLTANWEPLYYLREDVVFEAYKCLTDELSNLKQLLILQNLLQVHYSQIFANSEFQVYNQRFIEKVSVKLSELFQAMKSGIMDLNGAASCGLNSYLSFLKCFMMATGRKMKAQFLDSSWKKFSYLQGDVLSWAPFMLANSNYLFLLLKILGMEGIQERYNSQLRQFEGNIVWMKALAKNVLQQDGQRRNLSFSIIVLLIELLQPGEGFVKQFFPDFMAIVFKLYRDYRANTKMNGENRTHLFRGFSVLGWMLEGLHISDSAVEKESSSLSSEFFQIVLAFLLGEKEGNASILYKILVYSVSILINNRVAVLSFLPEKLLKKILTDLESKESAEILSSGLRIVLKLLRSADSSSNSYHYLMDYLYNNDFDTTLQNLQFCCNRQVSIYALQLLQNEFKQQSYQLGQEYCDGKVEGNYLMR